MVDVRPELARLAAAAGPSAGRASDMLRVLRRAVPFDGAWVALLVGSEYVTLASLGIGADVEESLSGPVRAREIALTRAECLIPSGLHEALATALFEPGGRHVGFIAVLTADRRAPSAEQRRDLARTTDLLARVVDPMSSIAALGRLVDDAFAGVVLYDDGTVARLPGLDGASADALLDAGSGLLRSIRTRPPTVASPTCFLWPVDEQDDPNVHVRVTSFALSDAVAPGIRGVVLLSPPTDLHGLTRRELEVLGHVLEGSSNDQIARELVVTSRTVATHVEHILVKLSSPSRTHAAVRALREGLYVPPSPVR